MAAPMEQAPLPASTAQKDIVTIVPAISTLSTRATTSSVRVTASTGL